MKKIVNNISVKINQVKCNGCSGTFFEFNEQITTFNWAGGKRISDLRKEICPHCGNEISYESSTVLNQSECYLTINEMSGECEVISSTQNS